MSIEPAWCFFRIPPKDTREIEVAFEAALEESGIVEKAQAYSIKRDLRWETASEKRSQFLNEDTKELFSKRPDLFDWEDINETHDLFFSTGLDDLVENLADPYETPLSITPTEAIIDYLSSDRVGPSQILYGGLGWVNASKLPGYFGNMFIPFDEVLEVYDEISAMFSALNERKLSERAREIGARGNLNDAIAGQVIQVFTSAIEKVKRERNGLLTVNFSHLGHFPF